MLVTFFIYLIVIYPKQLNVSRLKKEAKVQGVIKPIAQTIREYYKRQLKMKLVLVEYVYVGFVSIHIKGSKKQNKTSNIFNNAMILA